MRQGIRTQDQEVLIFTAAPIMIICEEAPVCVHMNQMVVFRDLMNRIDQAYRRNTSLF